MAAGRRVQPAENIEQCAFPGTGWSHNGNKFTACHLQGNISQYFCDRISHGKFFYEMSALNGSFADCMFHVISSR